MTGDPFIGGLQTATDRKLKINELGADEVLRVLRRTDLQPGVRKHAEDRLRRLYATRAHEERIAATRAKTLMGARRDE